MHRIICHSYFVFWIFKSDFHRIIFPLSFVFIYSPRRSLDNLYVYIFWEETISPQCHLFFQFPIRCIPTAMSYFLLFAFSYSRRDSCNVQNNYFGNRKMIYIYIYISNRNRGRTVRSDPMCLTIVHGIFWNEFPIKNMMNDSTSILILSILHYCEYDRFRNRVLTDPIIMTLENSIIWMMIVRLGNYWVAGKWHILCVFDLECYSTLRSTYWRKRTANKFLWWHGRERGEHQCGKIAEDDP